MVEVQRKPTSDQRSQGLEDTLPHRQYRIEVETRLP